MKTLFTLALLAASASAATWTGTVVDTMCAKKDLATHTTECAIGCSKSGYGIATADGKFIKFDDTGNAKTLAVLKATKKQDHLKATVTGKIENGMIQVASIHLTQ